MSFSRSYTLLSIFLNIRKRLKTAQAFYQIDGSFHINEKDKFIHKLETGNTFLPMLTDTQNSQRITEQLRLEGTLKVISFQPLASDRTANHNTQTHEKDCFAGSKMENRQTHYLSITA